MHTKIGTLAAVGGLILDAGRFGVARGNRGDHHLHGFDKASNWQPHLPDLHRRQRHWRAVFFDGFTEAAITSISWSLDPTTDAVIALDLSRFRVTIPARKAWVLLELDVEFVAYAGVRMK